MTIYGVTIESGAETVVDCKVQGGPEAYNTARAIAHGVARVYPGAIVAVLRNGRPTERYSGERTTTVKVCRVIGRRSRNG
jgi:hypothetical protein